MVKATFKGSQSSYGYVCKACLRKVNFDEQTSEASPLPARAHLHRQVKRGGADTGRGHQDSVRPHQREVDKGRLVMSRLPQISTRPNTPPQQARQGIIKITILSLHTGVKNTTYSVPALF